MRLLDRLKKRMFEVAYQPDVPLPKERTAEEDDAVLDKEREFLERQSDKVERMRKEADARLARLSAQGDVRVERVRQYDVG